MKIKISMIHLGVDLNLSSTNFVEKTKPYILFVGSRGRYKNFFNFIKSYSISKKINSNFNLVFFGGGKFNREEQKLLHNLKINNEKNYP
jgi:glycosyltransferase involved in cell wall biosynthesis